jgi:VanZ family protein
LRQRVTACLSLFLALFIAAACFAVLLTAPAGQAQPIGRDKWLHAGGSAGLGVVAATLTEDRKRAWALAMAPGVAKELYDARPGGTGFSVPDLIADGVGAYLGVRLGGRLIIKRRHIVYSRPFTL